jgi:hypothetical protein
LKTQGNNDAAGRTAALSNHSPEKIKIKTSGLLVEPIAISVEKNHG